jgi:hypothetical protein
MNAMKLRMAAAALVLCFSGAAFGQQPDGEEQQAAQEERSPYVVVRPNANIAFAERTIVGYRVGLDRSLILRAIGNRWYRATLDRPCARDLRWEFSIGVRIPTTGSLYANDQVIIDGRRCFIHTLDEIADPREVERAARAAKREAG